MEEANPLLVKYFPELSPAKGSRVFIPLCGKTLDISWLLKCSCRVVGAELSELAIQQLFDEMKVSPKISVREDFKIYREIIVSSNLLW